MIIYSLPFISAIIGWFTNLIAVKMLFHPRKKINLGIVTLQGIFPKRQKVLAEKLGSIVAEELFSFKDVKEFIKDPQVEEDAKKIIDEKLNHFLDNKLGEAMPMLTMFLNDSLKAKIKETIEAEFIEAFPVIIENLADKLEEKINVKEIVYQKVANFSSEKLEEILFSIMKKEFKFIELLGGILGFIIGLVQLGIVKFSKI